MAADIPSATHDPEFNAIEDPAAENRALKERIGELEKRCQELDTLSHDFKFERDGYYAEWQTALHSLEAIHRSTMWQLWMFSIAVRRVLFRPFELLFWLGRHFCLGLGALFLQITVGIERLRARQRRPQNPPETSGRRPQRRPRVLIVSPYPIYPPNHGGGVRLYNLVRGLSEHCELYLFVFTRCGEDEVQRRALGPFVRRIDFHRWMPSLNPDCWGMVPPNVQLFASSSVACRIRDLVISQNIDIVQLEYAELGQYRTAVPKGIPVVLTEHDIAFRSQDRRQRLGFTRRFPETRSFGATRVDWRRLLRFELAACRRADQIHTMSVDDGRFLSRYLEDGASRLRVVPNGVDITHYTAPEEHPRSGVLYVGNFQNLPNVDALEYFINDIWPLLRLEHPDAMMSVVGANPSERIQRFDGQDGVKIVGEVDDIGSAYHQHRVMVAPIRAGSGTRLKILEAFAAGIPVVSTSLGAEGIVCQDGRHLLIADTPVDFARATRRLLEDDDLHCTIAKAARELALARYDWRHVVDVMVAAYAELMSTQSAPRPVLPEVLEDSAVPSARPKVSILIPTFCGGAKLFAVLAAIEAQETSFHFEIICIDSGSPDAELDRMHKAGARVLRIDKEQFNHGLTRDLAASHSRGEILVFLNQDAVPADARWLEKMVFTLEQAGPAFAAVQGAMREVDDLQQRFYWDSCGDRFYFTTESCSWISNHRGIGFSTVNCGIKKAVWERFPFGWAPIMEDKKWQRDVLDNGLEIACCPDSIVIHSHTYNLKTLLRRCASEGHGWRWLGESYSIGALLRDMVGMRVWFELGKGLLTGRVRSLAELGFPILRPLALFWGNHFAKRVHL